MQQLRVEVGEAGELNNLRFFDDEYVLTNLRRTGESRRGNHRVIRAIRGARRVRVTLMAALARAARARPRRRVVAIVIATGVRAV